MLVAVEGEAGPVSEDAVTAETRLVIMTNTKTKMLMDIYENIDAG